MTFRVVILPRAKRQLYESALWWSDNRSSEQAVRWLDGLERALSTLENDPERFDLAPEDDDFLFAVRQLLRLRDSRLFSRREK